MNLPGKPISRRSFVRTAGASAAALGGPLFLTRPVSGANDRIRVAVLGVNGRGQDHIQGFMRLENVEITTLCDPDANVLAERAKEFENQYKKKVQTVRDLRKIYDDKEIDAVSIATPNHWHSLAAIWACQAGKDVYVEKPGSHNIWEGRKMVEAAAKYNRIENERYPPAQQQIASP